MHVVGERVRVAGEEGSVEVDGVRIDAVARDELDAVLRTARQAAQLERDLEAAGAISDDLRGEMFLPPAWTPTLVQKADAAVPYSRCAEV